MLITTCTHCLARFRVSPQQLNAKQGQVRCGRCGKVFSGFEALERFPDDDTGSRLLAAREREARLQAPSAEPPMPEALPEFETLDIDARSPETHEAAPGSEAPRAQPPAAAMGASAAAGPSSVTGSAAPARTSEPPRSKPLSRVTPPAPRRKPSRWWTVGSVLLFVLLGGELAFAFRAPLAQSYPPLRPWLENACARMSCVVGWSRDERQLKLEDSQLLEVPGEPNEIALTARIRNLASVPQEYPYLELTLTDIGGQAAARRVLRPADYLGHAPSRDEVLAAGTEVALQLRLQTARIKATGYELLLFYP